MDWISTLISSLAGVITALAGTGLLFYRQNRRLKNAEAAKQEQDTQHAYVEEWKELYERKEKKVEALETKLDELRRQKNEAERGNSLLAIENERLKFEKCTVNGCKNRRPPHYYDTDGNELLPSCGNCG